METNKTKKLILIFIFFALSLSLINITVEHIYFEGSANKVAIQNASKKAIERENLIKEFLNSSSNTLASLRGLDKFQQFLEDPKHTKIDLENIFLSYSRSQPSLMQVRYIDESGLEKIRVDRDKEGLQPYVVEETRFQDKSKRYYFKGSKVKQLEKVWFSALDLNIENNKIEIPFKPTLRAILPVNNNGSFGGILILNYHMGEFLEKFVDTPLYDMILCDDKGYTLIHPDKSKNWGNYTEPRFNISKMFPKNYETILNNKTFQTKHFVSKRLELPIQGGLNLILQMKKSYVENQELESKYQYLVTALITFIASLILIYVIIRFYSRTLLNLEELSKMNQELQATSSLLEDEKQKYKTIFNNTQDGIALVDSESRFIDCNTAFLKLTGYNKDEILTKSCKDLTVQADIEKNEQALKYAKEHGLIENIEKSCVTKSGSTININMSISLLPDKEHLLLSLKDISSLKLLEQQERLFSMSEMVTNISHQWRQPLSVITTSASGLRMKAEYGMDILQEQVTEFSDVIVKQAEYLSSTIDNFRNFIRGDIVYKKTSVKETLEQALDLSSVVLKTNYILLVKNIEDDFIISGNINELAQAFINIINNSRDALKEKVSKEEDRFIFVSTNKLDEHTFEITFQDSAGGIDEKIIDRVLEPYFTTKHQDLGTGLGLSVAYQIVHERHRGELQVSNEEFEYHGQNYKGACFKIMFKKENEV